MSGLGGFGLIQIKKIVVGNYFAKYIFIKAEIEPIFIYFRIFPLSPVASCGELSNFRS